MNRIRKRFFSILLSLAMVLTLLPGVSFTVLAADPDSVTTETELRNALNNAEQTIQLENDIVVEGDTLSVAGAKTLNLNGHGIIMTGGHRVIQIPAEAALTLTDSGSTTHYYTVENGLATVVDDSTAEGTTPFTGGYITGGVASGLGALGGGIQNAGTFTMNGGTILGNKGFGAGGVSNTGTFTMTAGSILYNKSEYSNGGGVHNEADFVLSGGAITDNTAAGNGGGVSNVKNAMSTKDASFSVSGKVNVTGNKGNGSAKNVYLDGAIITVAGALDDSSQIGVSMSTPGTFTSGLFNYGSKDTFTSDDATYVVVDDEGEAKLTQKVSADSITLKNGDEAITEETVLNLTPAGTVTLTADVLPTNTTDTVVWSSSDETIATVDENGIITAVAAGEATITATAGDVSATVAVTVTADVPATGIQLMKGTDILDEGATIPLNVNDETTLTAVVTPEGTTDTVEWTSTAEAVATVENGKITAVAAGEATITATAGDVSATVAVTVTAAETKYSVTYDANGGTGALSDENSPYASGAEVTVLDNGFTRDGYYFTGWKDDDETEYAPGAKFNIAKNITLYAQWAEKTVLTVKAKSDTIEYDGKTHTINSFVQRRFLIDGNYYTVSNITANGSGKDVGEYEVAVTGEPIVKDTAEKEVTERFSVNLVPGKLTITKRSLTFESGSDSKPYDGTPLTKPGVTLTEGAFAEGENATYVATGSQTEVGSSPNTIEITPDEGTDLENYEITKNEGTLTVTAKYSVTYDANGGTGALSDENSPYDSGAEVTVLDNGFTREGFYFTGWKDAGGTDYAPGAKFEIEGDITLYAQWAEKTELTVRAKTVSHVYDGTTKTVEGLRQIQFPDDGRTYSMEGLSASISKKDAGEYDIEVTGENPVIMDVTDAENPIDVTDHFIVKRVPGKLTITKRSLTFESESATKPFDDEPLTKPGVTLTEGEFAEGEGATYVATGSQTAIGESTNTIVITPDEGTDLENYEITKNEGTLTVTPAETKYSVTYDANDGTGEPLIDGNSPYVPGAEVSVLPNTTFEKDGYYFTGWKDAGGTDYAPGAKFEIEGDITLYAQWAEKIELTVRAKTETAQYNGKTQSVDSFVQRRFLIGNEYYTVFNITANGSGKDVGEYDVAVTGEPIVRDTAGKEVTERFSVNLVPGKLTITKRNLTFESDSASKDYDGEPLVADHVTVTGDGFAEGEGVEFDVTGYLDEVGTAENTFSYEAYEGTDLNNYEIKEIVGTLEILTLDKRIPITLQVNSESIPYDGQEHILAGAEEYTFEHNGVNFTVTGLTGSVSGTKAGTYPLTVSGTPVVKDAAGKDRTSQFRLTMLDGALTIEKRTVTLTSASKTREYNGKALTNHTVTVGGQLFVDGEGATYTYTGSQTIVGETNNTFGYTLNENTDPDNYIITTNEGLLKVTNRNEPYVVPVQTNSATEKYDGTEKVASGWTIEGASDGSFTTVDGVSYTLTGVSAEVRKTDAGVYDVDLVGEPIVLDENNNDVTEQFVLDVQKGALTIEPRSLTFTSGSAEKMYDGKALTKDEVKVSGEGFADDEGATWTVTGSRTIPGESENTFEIIWGDNTKEANYAVTTVYGTLNVTERDTPFEITVNANSDEFLYDGTEKTVSGFETLIFIENEVEYTVSGLSATASGTDAGEYAVVVTGNAKVEDSEGNDVTSQFNVETVNGKLTINKRDVTLTSASDEKEYDGTALTNSEVTVGGNEFADGEWAAYSVTGSQTIVGESENTFTYTLKGNAKAENYNITTEFGTLSVTNRTNPYPVTLKANSDEVMYDGKVHTVSGLDSYTFVENGVQYFVSGLTASGTGTDAGEYPIKVSGNAVIKDEGNHILTDQFAVTTEDGKLEITKRNVTLTSASAEKEYDGTPLTNDEVTIGGDGFADGEGVDCNVTGSQTVVGSSSNSFTYELKGNTKGDNYTITTATGNLNVVNRDAQYNIELTPVSQSLPYNGAKQSISGFETTEFIINGNTYTVSGYEAFAEGEDAGTYPVSVEGSPTVVDSEGADVTSQFAVSLVQGSTLTITPRNVTLKSADLEKMYDGSALTNGDAAVEVGGDKFVEGQGVSYEFTGSQTLPGSSANSFDFTRNQYTKEKNYIITKTEGTLTVTDRPEGEKYEITVVANSGEEEYVYDGTQRSISGFENLEFTCDGITYTVSGLGASASGKDAGEYVAEVTGTAKVTDPAGNDLTEQFLVKTQDGKLTIKPREVTLTSASAEKEYDGKPLTNSNVSITSGSFADGEGVELFTVTGSQRKVGDSSNLFTYELKTNTKEKNYNITTLYGILKVTTRGATSELHLVPVSDSLKYNGTEQSISGFVTTQFVVDGEKYTVTGLTAEAKGTNAGTYPVTITGDEVKVWDNYGDEVTSEFKVTSEPGTLTITPCNVTVTSKDATKKYDGKPLTKHEVDVSGDGFAEGDVPTYVFTGKQTTFGSSKNYFECNLPEDIAGNYIIEKHYGTLTVNHRDTQYSVTVVANSLNEKYDGTEKEVTGWTINGVAGGNFTTEDGVEYTLSGLTASGTGTNAGEYPVTFDEGEWTVTDSDGEDVTDEFALTLVPGTLEISKRNVTLESPSAEKEYDGTPLYNRNMEIKGDGFAEGEGVDIVVSGSQTIPGESDNTFNYTLKEGTSEVNYEITETVGKLTVTSRTDKYEVSPQANSDEFKYDGEEHTVSGFATLTFNVEGNVYTVENLKAEAKGTDADTYPVEVEVIEGDKAIVRDSKGNDVTSEFIVTPQDGTLTINKRKITLSSGSASRQYDGTALTNDTVTSAGDDFVDGEAPTCAATGTQTIPGSSDNVLTVIWPEGTNKNNYEITIVEGKLEVTNRTIPFQITVEANSGEFEYDGEEHTVSDFTQESYQVNEKTFTVEGLAAEAKGTDADTYPVEVKQIEGESVVVKDSEGNDVTLQFQVRTKDGTLKIEPREVTLTSATDSKQYDGKPLTNKEVTVSGKGFVDGQGVTCDVTGSQTLPGESDNTFTYTWNEGTNADNYNITKVEGTLEVTDRTEPFVINVTSNSATATYDGAPKLVQGWTLEGSEDNKITIDGVTFTVDGMVAFTSETEAGSHPVPFVGTPFVQDSDGNYVTGQFAINLNQGELTINKRKVTLTSATDSKPYDGKPLMNDNVTVGGDGFVMSEGATYNVTGSVTYPGESKPNTFTYELKDGTKEDNYEITKTEGTLSITDRTDEGDSKKFEISVEANSGEFQYDGSEKTVDGFKTLEFNINDVNYTVSGLSAEAKGTDAGEYTVAVTGNAVVKDASNHDLTAQFIVNKVDGALSITKRNVTLTSASDTKEYDGNALTNPEVTVGGDGFVTGEGATYDVTGSQKLVGTSQNTFTYALKDGTKAGNYIITTKEGTLNVTDRAAKYEIAPLAVSAEEKYNGKAHTVQGFVTNEFTVDGNTYTVSGLSAGATATNRGSYQVAVSGTATVKDSDGNVVTDQFKVSPVNGTLVITPREVTLTSATDSKPYDGTPLTNKEVTVSGDGFVEGQGAEYSVTGTRTIVGVAENTFTYELHSNTDANNYDITTSYGTLTVNPRDPKYTVTVTANSREVPYNGSTRAVSGWTIDGVEGGKFTTEEGVEYTLSGLSAEAEGMNAGSYTANITGTPTIIDADNNNVTDQFAIDAQPGTLTVTKRNVTLTSATNSKPYDGTPLVDETIIVGGEKFADDEGATYNVTGSIVLPGEVDNAFTYDLKEGTDADNYNIVSTFGKLSITNRSDEDKYAISVEANSEEFLYDGTEKTVSGFKTLSFIENGVEYKVSGLSAEAKRRDAGETEVEVFGDATVSDVYGHDLTKQFNVTKVNGKLTIKKRNVTLTSGSKSKVYDEKPLTDNTVNVGGDKFAAGEGATFKVTGTRTAIGSSANAFSYTLKTGSKAENYNITKKDGILTVNAPSAEDADKAIRALEGYADPIGSKIAPLYLTSNKQTTKSILLNWNYVSGAVKYVLYGNRCGKKTKQIKLLTTTNTSKTLKKIHGKKIKKGSSYKFNVVALDKNNQVISISKTIHIWTPGTTKGNSSVKLTTPKKTRITLWRGNSLKIKAKQVVKRGMRLVKHAGLRYESTNPAVASVSSKGKIVAKGPGTCKIIIYAQSGKRKTIRVTVQ